MKTSNQKQSHIRFTEEEYKTILEDAELYQNSIPEQLKTVYFRRYLARPVMFPVDARSAIAELNRMGNNINQIARKVNSGTRYGFAPILEEIANDIRAMKYFLMGHHGNS